MGRQVRDCSVSWRGLGGSLPRMLPTQYPTRYNAATVVFLVYPATLVAMRDRRATKGVAAA